MDDGLLSPLAAALNRPLTLDEQGAVLFAGVQTRCRVPELRKIPPTFGRIKAKPECRRATNAWKAASRLEAMLLLWHEFLMLVLIRARLDAQTEEKISHFPGLEDVGAVLNALAQQVSWQPDLAQLLPEFDATLKQVRAPTERHREEDVRPFLGRRLRRLINEFRKLMITDAQCLHLLDVNAPTFRRPTADIFNDIADITCVDLDFTGEGEPIDADKTLKSGPFRAAFDRMRGGARELLQQLETYPETVLARWGQSSTSNPISNQSTPGLPLGEAEVAVRNYLKENSNAKRRQVADAIGCSPGQVSRTAAWKLVAETRGKKKIGGKKIGLDIAAEEKAIARYKESEREEEDESSVQEGGKVQGDNGLDVEDRQRLERMTPDERAEFYRLMTEQEREQRADRRRSRK